MFKLLIVEISLRARAGNWIGVEGDGLLGRVELNELLNSMVRSRWRYPGACLSATGS